jgi:hypothetical protein
MDAAFRSDPLKLRVQLIAQYDECVAGHAPMPSHAQPLDHFGKPNSLRITRSHVGTIVLREARPSKGCAMQPYHPRPIGVVASHFTRKAVIGSTMAARRAGK